MSARGGFEAPSQAAEGSHRGEEAPEEHHDKPPDGKVVLRDDQAEKYNPPKHQRSEGDKDDGIPYPFG